MYFSVCFFLWVSHCPRSLRCNHVPDNLGMYSPPYFSTQIYSLNPAPKHLSNCRVIQHPISRSRLANLAQMKHSASELCRVCVACFSTSTAYRYCAIRSTTPLHGTCAAQPSLAHCEVRTLLRRKHADFRFAIRQTRLRNNQLGLA
jgi:hypothetical protein